MRNNQPITQRERTFPAQQRLISTTDAKGVITYCNDAFVEISGFSREELIRAPLAWSVTPTCRLRCFRTCGAH